MILFQQEVFFSVRNESCLSYILLTYPYITLCSLRFWKSEFFLKHIL